MDAVQRERLFQRAVLELLAVQTQTGVRVLLLVRAGVMSVEAVVLNDEDDVERARDAADEQFGEVLREIFQVVCLAVEREREIRTGRD